MIVMKFAAILMSVMYLAIPASASNRPAPTGSFVISSQTDSSITFVVTALTGVTNSYEVTLGVWCDPTIAWGNVGSQSIYEFNSFGRVLIGYPLILALPNTGVQENCTARLIAAYWFKGVPKQAWTLDEHLFTYPIQP